MQACIFTNVPSYEACLQRGSETVGVSPENDAILEFITEETKWMPQMLVDASDVISLDAAVQQTDLNDTLQLNRQLHTTLQKKQDEIFALRKKNSQLKELVKQAEHLAHLLDTIAPSTGATKQAAACSLSSYGLGCSPTEPHSPSVDKHEWESTVVFNSQHADIFSSSQTETDQTCGFPSDSGSQCLKSGPASPYTGLKRCLWPCQDASGSTSAHDNSTEDIVAFQRDAKRRKDDQELLQAQLQQYLEEVEWDLQQPKADSAVGQENHETELQKSDLINIYGTFHGLHIVRATLSTDSDSSERGEVMCFKTFVREHSTIRTRVFPHGKSFTSPTPAGGYRFLWIPIE